MRLSDRGILTFGSRRICGLEGYARRSLDARRSSVRDCFVVERHDWRRVLGEDKALWQKECSVDLALQMLALQHEGR